MEHVMVPKTVIHVGLIVVLVAHIHRVEMVCVMALRIVPHVLKIVVPI